MKPEHAPRMQEWITVSDAAAILKISRQTVNHMVHDGVFDSLHLLGSKQRPQFLLNRYEVEELSADRDRIDG